MKEIDFTNFLKEIEDARQQEYKTASELAPPSARSEIKTANTDAAPYIRLSDVQVKDVEWLWYPYIPLGKITYMDADPGVGKTFLALYLASQVSTGRAFYDEPEKCREPRTVFYLTAEDGIEDTIKPRLVTMQPDFNNIYILNEEKSPLRLSDTRRIENIMREQNPALMIFDPLQAYLGANVDMNRANQVRPILSSLAHLAENYHCAVLLISHLSKNTKSSALHRGIGSIDITAIARSVLVLGKDPDNPAYRIMCHEKSSLAAKGQSLRYQICPSTGGIKFSGYSNLTADDVLAQQVTGRCKPSVVKNCVTEALLELFDDKDYIRVDDITALCDRIGCSRSTLYRARDELKLQFFSTGFSSQKTTFWLLPNVDICKFKDDLNANRLIP